MVDDQRLADVLIEFARTLVRETPIQGILDRLVQRIIEVVPVTGAGVMLMADDLRLHFVAASDEKLLRIESLQAEFGEGPCIEAYRTGKQVLIPDLGADRRFVRFSPRARESGLGAVFSFPMRVDQEKLGALDLYQREPAALSATDLTAAQILADVATAYLVNSRARQAARDTEEDLRQRVLHDNLTGLPNRVLLHDRLSHAVAKAQRSGAMAAVLFVDLDRFKSVNDQYGHHAGDQVLVAVAHRLSHAVRPGDTVARLSGDEFVIVCEELADAKVAEFVARRVADVMAQPIPLEGSRTIALTASVGVAFAGKGVDLPEAILRDADAAMFAAKADGGSRYVVAAEAVHRRTGTHPAR